MLKTRRKQSLSFTSFTFCVLYLRYIVFGLAEIFMTSCEQGDTLSSRQSEHILNILLIFNLIFTPIHSTRLGAGIYDDRVTDGPSAFI